MSHGGTSSGILATRRRLRAMAARNYGVVVGVNSKAVGVAAAHTSDLTPFCVELLNTAGDSIMWITTRPAVAVFSAPACSAAEQILLSLAYTRLPYTVPAAD